MPPHRIVSLCPSITETLVDMGLSDRIVGVTRFCIHPAEVVADLPKVGGTKDPDVEAILAAKPDLVFMNAEENRKEDHDRLARAVHPRTWARCAPHSAGLLLARCQLDPQCVNLRVTQPNHDRGKPWV